MKPNTTVSKSVVKTTVTKTSTSSNVKPVSKTVVSSTTTKTSSTSNTKPVVKTVVSTSKTSSKSNNKPVNKTVVTSTTTKTSSSTSNTKPVVKTAVVTSSTSSRSNTKPVPKTTPVVATTTSSRSNTKPVPQSTAVVTSTSKTSSLQNSKPASKPESKPASKAPSQSQSKKVEVRKVVYSSDDGGEIQDTFEFFDSNGNGKIDAREVRGAMQNIGYDETNPKIYEVMTELDNPRNKNTGGVSFNDFCQTVNYRLPEKETEEELRRVFNLFLDDPNSDTTSLESIKRVADELGENIEEVELNAMLNKASKSGARLTFDDFVALMTGKDL